MARIARQISQSGLYHIVFRGVNRQHIFEEEADYIKLKEILMNLKMDMGFEIYVYCFMTNHAHILLKERETGDISQIMKRLLTKYARWYNIKYKRSGALIANRYKSQPVEVDEYFLSVVRYIHQNPLKARMIKELNEYEWSSYNEYAYSENGLADKEFILEMINGTKGFEEYHEIMENNIFIVDDKVKITDDGIRRNIIKKYGIEPNLIGGMDKQKRNEILCELKESYSIRQLERVTGVSRGVIQKC